MISIICAALICMVSHVNSAAIANELEVYTAAFDRIIEQGPDATAALAYAKDYCDTSVPFIPHLHANNETNCVIDALETYYDQPRLDPSWICSVPGHFLDTHAPASYVISSVTTSVTCGKIISDRFANKLMPFRGPVKYSDCDNDVHPGHPMSGSYLMMLDLANYCCYDGWPNRNTVCDVENQPSPTPSPTTSPTMSPTMSPTNSPTMSPTMSPTNSPTVSPTLPVSRL